MTFPEGTQRIICDSDLDDPSPGNGNGNGNGPQPGPGDPAMFSGEAPYKPSTTTGMPKVAIGTGDYAMEWFIKGRTSVSAAGTETKVNTGLVTATSGDTQGTLLVGMLVDDASDILTTIRVQTGLGAVELTTLWDSSSWAHACVSADRAGLATLYLDGASVATADISSDSGTDLVSTPVHPMLPQSNVNSFYDDLPSDNHNLVDNSLVVLSSFAIHAGQLSPEQVQVNSDAKLVGLYIETFVRYLFDSFVDAAGASITPTKETTASSISLFPKFGLPSPQDTELFVPIGTPGDVFIEDSSGTGRHWPLRVQTSYDSAAIANRGACGFATTGAS